MLLDQFRGVDETLRRRFFLKAGRTRFRHHQKRPKQASGWRHRERFFVSSDIGFMPKRYFWLDQCVSKPVRSV